MNREDVKNEVKVSGMIATELSFSHEVMGEKFYSFSLECKRQSETVDSVPVIVSDRLVDTELLEVGTYITVYGSFRSYNKHLEGKNKLLLNVFAEQVEYADESVNDNEITIEGYLCKEVVVRTTPLGREIADMLVAVNRAYGKSDYLPCLGWGRNAAFCGTLPVGTLVRAKGRIQSRVYMKNEQEHTAYEVSLSAIQAE